MIRSSHVKTVRLMWVVTRKEPREFAIDFLVGHGQLREFDWVERSSRSHLFLPFLLKTHGRLYSVKSIQHDLGDKFRQFHADDCRLSHRHMNSPIDSTVGSQF